MRRSVSISGPKAFSMRNAISPESAARAFSRLDRVTRETWSARAASVTDIPSGSMTSVRMKSPGWTGFFIRFSVVIFIVHLDDLFQLHTKCQTPVACDVKAPGIFAAPGQPMRLPRRDRVQLRCIRHVLQKSQHSPELGHGIGSAL